MQVDDLLAYQLVPSVISAVRAAGVERLWPLQEKAVRAGALAGDGAAQAADLLISGPSASGKTLLLELCAIQAAHSGRRVLCVLPTDERAAAVAARLRSRYQRLGLRIGTMGATGELAAAAGRTEPARGADGESGQVELDVALVSAAALGQQRVLCPQLLCGVDVALVDELEALADPRLGPAVELALLQLQHARTQEQRAGERRMQLLLSCGEAAGLRELAATLGAELVVEERRPVELRLGVVHGGRLAYVSSRDDRGSARRCEEELYEPPRPRSLRAAPSTDAGGRGAERTPLMHLVAELCMRGEQTLVLVPDKARAVIAAEQIITALRACPPAPATEALRRLAGTPEGQAQTLLRETLSRGVALLEPGMLPCQRELVLAACRDGEVRVLCVTQLGELSQQLDPELRFRNVVVTERWLWRYQRRTRGYSRDELGWRDWERIAGRASWTHTPGAAAGRVMLLTPSRYDAEVALRARAEAVPEPLLPALRGEPLEEIILSLLAGQLCRREDELAELLAQSVTGRALWSSPAGAGELRSRIATAVQTLQAQELVQRDAAEAAVLVPTLLGRLGAASGVPVRTLLLMLRWAEAARQVEFTALEVFLALSLSPSGADAAVPLLLSEQEASDYWSRTLLRAAAEGAAERPLFRWLRAQAGVVRFEQTRALKKSLLLCDFIAGRSGPVLEQDYHLWRGALLRAAQEFARLVAVLRTVCALRGWTVARLQTLDALARRLRQEPQAPLALSDAAAAAAADGHLLADAPLGDLRDAAAASGPERGTGVARAVFAIRAALLAGAGGQAVAPAAAAAVGGSVAEHLAEHLIEPT